MKNKPMKYLILKCDPLNDQYECDAFRSPVTMTDDYESWIKRFNPSYDFEIFEYNYSKDNFKFLGYWYNLKEN